MSIEHIKQQLDSSCEDINSAPFASLRTNLEKLSPERAGDRIERVLKEIRRLGVGLRTLGALSREAHELVGKGTSGLVEATLGSNNPHTESVQMNSRALFNSTETLPGAIQRADVEGDQNSPLNRAAVALGVALDALGDYEAERVCLEGAMGIMATEHAATISAVEDYKGAL
jgi:hypothetical protein